MRKESDHFSIEIEAFPVRRAQLLCLDFSFFFAFCLVALANKNWLYHCPSCPDHGPLPLRIITLPLLLQVGAGQDHHHHHEAPAGRSATRAMQ